MSTDHLQELLDRLTAVRDKYGEGAFNDAAKDIARQLIAQGGAEAEFAKEAFKDVPGINEPVSKSDEPALPHQIINMVQQTMPGIKTQAQFDAFMNAFEGLRVSFNGIFVGDRTQEAEGKQVVDKAFDLARKVTQACSKLEEIPEAAASPQAEQFKKPPVEFLALKEEPIFQQLMCEVMEPRSLVALTQWYESVKPQLDCVVTQDRRNKLFDTIRKRKAMLTLTSICEDCVQAIPGSAGYCPRRAGLSPEAWRDDCPHKEPFSAG